MKCSAELISAFHDGDLSPAARQRVIEHLATCQPCWAVLATYRRIGAELRALPVAVVPASLDSRVHARLDELARPRRRPLGGPSWLPGLGALAAVVLIALAMSALLRAYDIGAPTIASASSPLDHAVDVPLDAAVPIVFHEPVDRQRVQQSARIEPPAEVDFEWRDRELMIRPKSGLQAGTEYRIVVVPAAVETKRGPQPTVVIAFRTEGTKSDTIARPVPAAATRAVAAALATAAPPSPPEPAATVAIVVPVEALPPKVSESPTTVPPRPATPVPTAAAVASGPPARQGTPRGKGGTPSPAAVATTVPVATKGPAPKTMAEDVTAVASAATSTAPLPSPVAKTAVEEPTPAAIVATTAALPSLAALSPATAISATAAMSVPRVEHNPPPAKPADQADQKRGEASISPVDCSEQAMRSFALVFRVVRQRLGCAIEGERTITLTEQAFERGYTFRRTDLSDSYVLGTDADLLTAYEDVQQQDWPADGSATTAAAPVARPDQTPATWRSSVEAKNLLGKPVAAERSFTAVAQDFQRGTVLWSDRRVIYVLYAEGTWQDFPDTSKPLPRPSR